MRDATRYKKTYSLYRQAPRTADNSCAICNTILNGEGPPDDELGLIDDLYIDTLNMELYGPKPNDIGPWGSPIPLASAGGVASPIDSIQYNGGGYFLGSSAFTFVSGNLYLTGTFAQGNLSTALGQNSHAEGFDTDALGNHSHAEGVWTLAENIGSHAEGIRTLAGGAYSHAEGSFCTASAQYSHAEGYYSVASSDTSHAEGHFTLANGYASHAEGYFATSSGQFSHAEGSYSEAIGNWSHAGGLYTIASGSGQTTIGQYNKRNNSDSLFVIGNGVGDSDVDRSDIFLVNPSSVLVGSASLAPDTFFYVGTSSPATNSLFGGNVVVSGTFDVKDGSDASTLRVVNSMVGINVTPTTYALEVNGEFAATVKSFVINHPNKPGWKLRHGTLEGPENGVYVRGRSKSREVILPDYWKNLVDEDSITVHITPIGTPHLIYVTSTSIDRFTVDCLQPDIEYYYKVQAERKDYTFEVEYEDLS